MRRIQVIQNQLSTMREELLQIWIGCSEQAIVQLVNQSDVAIEVQLPCLPTPRL